MLQFPVSNSINALPGSSRCVDDTTFDRIRQHKVLREQLLSLWEAEDLAVAAAEQTHGDRPFSLISWRNYSAIGGSEIERVRDEFIMLGIPPDLVEREYLDAKRRYQKQKAKRREWAKKAGVHEINQKWKAVLEEQNNVMQSLIDQPPVTPKAASALIFYILEFYDGCEFDELACSCLEAIARSLSTIDGEVSYARASNVIAKG
jgi:hypothetical protein